MGLAGQSFSQDQKGELPKSKQTVLGFYLTSQEAYAMWQKNPAEIKVLDVRTPEEYYFIGHAAMARNIPWQYLPMGSNEQGFCD